MPFRRYKPRRFRKPFLTRKGRPAEVSNYTTAGNLSVDQTATFLAPAKHIVSVMSLASLTTDVDVNNVNSRTIPPQWRGVSVRGGQLKVDFAITKAPVPSLVETYHAMYWTSGWGRGVLWLYQDDFTWTAGAQTPDFDVFDPFRCDIIEGGVHTEFRKPQRILHRWPFTFPGAADLVGNGTPEVYMVNRAQMAWSHTFRVKKAYLNERTTLWLGLAFSSPWLTETSFDIGWVVSGPICYKLRSG